MSAQSISLLTLVRTLSATVAACRFVTAAGAQSGAGENAIGVARTGGVSGDKVPVDLIGTAIVESGAAITINDTLKADSTGRAITWASSGAKVALALQAASAAGEFIEVRLVDNVA
jgi:hypothetical protein